MDGILGRGTSVMARKVGLLMGGILILGAVLLLQPVAVSAHESGVVARAGAASQPSSQANRTRWAGSRIGSGSRSFSRSRQPGHRAGSRTSLPHSPAQPSPTMLPTSVSSPRD